MKAYNLILILALIGLVAAVPLYAAGEPARLARAQQDLQRLQLENGTHVYLENCALCHGADGGGNGMMPALNNPALTQAEPAFLYKVIARAEHDTNMAAWHMDEGGNLNEYQIQELVTLIRFADWEQVALAAAERLNPIPSPQPGYALEEDYLMKEAEEDPHRCIACHEEPEIHAVRFGTNCARCHSTESWTPAFLTRHTFRVDHGDQGEQACETCHRETYSQHTCYECHDHTPEDMQAVHLAEGLPDYENCVACHPTGQPGEAAALRSVGMLGTKR